MVRETLGEDAIIVATREEKGGKTVHVTAAVDPSGYGGSYSGGYGGAPAFEIGNNPTQPNTAASDWLQYDEEDENNAIAEELTDAMLRHGATEDVMDQIISCATVIGMDQPSQALVAAIEHLFNFRPLPRKPVRKPIMVVGPPGAGKTLAIAKMAARGTMDSLKIGVITTDTIRAGGVDQLEAFTKLLRIPLQKLAAAEDLGDMLSRMQGYDQILIDTAGLNPFNAGEIKNLARLIGDNAGSGSFDTYMVLPAGADAEESGDMARAFSSVGVNGLIPTRLDIARRLGGLLSAALHGHMVFADSSHTPKVADGLSAMTPQSLAALLMPSAFTHQGSNPARMSRSGNTQ